MKPFPVMNTIHYNVSSVTNAIRGQKILERNGLRAFVHRRSAAEEREGCGYSVWLSGAGPTQAAAAERLLRAAGIRILSVTESGRPEG